METSPTTRQSERASPLLPPALPPTPPERWLGIASLIFCASFLCVVFGIPIISVLSRTYEPEIFVVIFLLGIPLFLASTIVSIVGCFSESRSTKVMSRWGLALTWGPLIAIAFGGAILSIVL
jgi:hypothetical protein